MRVMLIASVIDSLLRSCFVSFSISIGDIPALWSFKYGVSSSTIFSRSISPELFSPEMQTKTDYVEKLCLGIWLTITANYLSIRYIFCRSTMHNGHIGC